MDSIGLGLYILIDIYRDDGVGIESFVLCQKITPGEPPVA